MEKKCVTKDPVLEHLFQLGDYIKVCFLFNQEVSIIFPRKYYNKE